MKKFATAVSVMFFLLAGSLSLAYLFVRLGETEWRRDWGYEVYVDFPTAGGLNPGSPVEVAGVQAGWVEEVSLDHYRAHVKLKLRRDLQLQEDAIASIRTKGLIGDKYLAISLGGSDRLIPPGGKIRETEPPVDLVELIAAYLQTTGRKTADGKSQPER
jgi:phospholipid/cholesterol/gamma-HCH transport system substrate-binding protein